ncbi:MaoC/PaaZ C-terminal domain-containing protein [Neobacillus fumarioli]|uniref:MaoC/PaaZ C-terminal domain-containing protein n=1 Tax=Neobacillus fumarioli TaxID=105229 RepID=UPI0008341681|nr:MaoC/PaaZ C-terminal domain-containing protein [Neobacillus fumarioli]
MSRLAELQVGQSLNEVSLAPVSRIALIKYAGASGDFNPIHTIDDEAAKAGLPGIIAHGMWTMGNLAKLFTEYYEEGFVKDYSIRFKNMVFLNDVITLKAELKEKQDKTLKFSVKAVNQHGKVTIAGNVVYQLY